MERPERGENDLILQSFIPHVGSFEEDFCFEGFSLGHQEFFSFSELTDEICFPESTCFDDFSVEISERDSETLDSISMYSDLKTDNETKSIDDILTVLKSPLPSFDSFESLSSINTQIKRKDSSRTKKSKVDENTNKNKNILTFQLLRKFSQSDCLSMRQCPSIWENSCVEEKKGSCLF